jgi:hypothetical protein
MVLPQAAEAMAKLASTHARDPAYKSPYTEEATRQGYDLPWWEKLVTSSFKDGKVELGTLRVRCLLKAVVTACQ